MNEFLFPFLFTCLSLTIYVLIMRMAAFATRTVSWRGIGGTNSTRTKPKDEAELALDSSWKMIESGLYEEADFEVHKILGQPKLKPDTRLRALYISAQISVRQNDLSQAEKKLWQALGSVNGNTNPLIPVALRHLLADIFYKQEQWELCERQLESAIALADKVRGDKNFDRSVVALHLKLGDLYRAQHSYPQAVVALQRAIELMDDDNEDREIAGNLLADSQRLLLQSNYQSPPSG